MEFFDLLDKCNKNCNKGRSKQFFLGNILNKGGWGCEILVAILFGHEIHISIPKFGQNSNFYS